MAGDLAHVLDHYDLGQLRSAKRTEYGFVDDNWIIDTDRGRFFLKRRHPRRRQTLQLVQAQHNLIRWLHGAGFPAPILVPNSAGATYLLVDDELYEMEEYIEGEPYDHHRPAHLAAAARTLGTLHDLLKGFAPGAIRELPALYSPEKARTNLHTLLVTWQLEHDPASAGVVRQLQDRCTELGDRFPAHGELPRQVIHGDFHAGNLLFDGDHIVGLVDYDKVNWQPRVAEVAEALIYFASPRRDCFKHLVYSGYLEWEPLADFLQHYAAATTLNSREVWALPDYVGCIWLSMSLQRLLERHPRRPAWAVAALKEVLALATWAVTNAQGMRTTAQMAMNAAVPGPQEELT